MDPIATTLLVAAILFSATFTRSALGFGDALLAMPLLGVLVGFRTATPLVAFEASTIALTILAGSWRQVDLRATWRLIVASLIGIPLGLLLLKDAPESLVKTLLGIILILFGLYKLFSPRLRGMERAEDGGGLAYLFGFVAGILGGAYNTNGPPVVIYAALRRWSPEQFRATLQGYFFPTGLMILAGHGLSGLWTEQVLRLYAFSLPAILLGVYLGGKANQAIPAGRFERLIYGMLVVFGGVLIAGSW